jgi:hypothetical protein
MIFFMEWMVGVPDRSFYVFGKARLRRPRVQGRAAALPQQEGEGSFHGIIGG